MFLPLAVFLLLALGWSIYWLVAIGTAKQQLSDKRSGLARAGLTLACSEEGWGGYPFHFEFTCLAPVLTYADKAELRSSKLLLVALAYAPWQVASLLDGPSLVSAQGSLPTTLEHQRALAAVTFAKDGELSLSAEVPALSVAGIGQAANVMLHTRPAAGGTEIALSVNNLHYDRPRHAPLAIDDGNLRGLLQSDHSLKIESFELQQGALRYWGSGTLVLDSQHRISGQLDTETNDMRALLTVVSPQLGLSNGQMANLRTMLNLLGSGAKAPIIAKDGVLYLGPFKLADLTPLY